jgi:hypothetical protein
MPASAGRATGTGSSNNLVLYYGDVGHWNGIVRIGRFNSDDLDFIRGQPDGFQVTIEQG